MQNKYDTRCTKCGEKLKAGEGYVRKEPNGWKPYCNAHFPDKIEAQALAKPNKLHGTGALDWTYDAANLALIRSLPGYRNVKVGDTWNASCSVSQADLSRTLELVRRLNFEIDPVLIEREKQKAADSQAAKRAEVAGLYPFQVVGSQWMSEGDKRLLGDEMGCIDGNAIVQINRAGASRKIKLADLYRKFNGGKTHGQKWNLSIPTMIRSLCDGDFRLNKIKAVLSKGAKPVVKIVLESGKSIRLTEDHEVRSATESNEEKWIAAGNLQIGDVVMTNGVPKCKLCGSIENVSGVQAKFPGHCRKCMYRVLRKNSNFKSGKFLDKDGYVRVSGCYDHPKSSRGHFVMEHVLVAEETLGRYLTPDEIVHHKNGIKNDNRRENLEVTTVNKHASHHGKHGGYRRLHGSVSGLGGLVCFVPKIDRVKSVKPDGIADVYDVVCEDPHRNFVANGIVVHNCGKTVQALAALDVTTAGCLVVCPNVVKYNWRNETARWRPDIKNVTVLSGRDSFRWPVPGEMLIINYDILPEWAGKKVTGESIPQPFVPDGETVKAKGVTLISDEVSAVKNYKSLRHVRVKTLSSLCAKTWFLTGTPLMTNPFDLSGILGAMGSFNAVFGNFNKFLSCFGGVKDRWGGYKFGSPRPEVPELLRRVMLRRTKAEVLPDLPKKQYTELQVNDVPADLKREMDDAWDEWGDVLETAEDEDALPPFEEFSRIRAKLAASRIGSMLEFVENAEEQGTPLVVFSAYRAPIDELAKREGWATITGDVKPEDRTEIVKAFQEGRLKGLGLTIAAGGLGITLTKASTVLFVDLDWTPALNAQAEDRLARIGQTASSINVYRMTSEHPLDKHVNRLIARKIEMSQKAIDSKLEVKPTAVSTQLIAGETEEEFKARMERTAEEDRVRATKIAEENRKAEQERKESERRHAASKVKKLYERGRSKIGEWIDQPMTPELEASIRGAFNMLCELDPDYAEELNGQGFNKGDSYAARWLGHNLGTTEELRGMFSLVYKYRRQIQGRFPNLYQRIPESPWL